jgi:hypothetical protein
VLEARAEEALVGRDRLVEVGHGDAEVMDSARLHAAIVSSRQSAATKASLAMPTSGCVSLLAHPSEMTGRGEAG